MPAAVPRAFADRPVALCGVATHPSKVNCVFHSNCSCRLWLAVRGMPKIASRTWPGPRAVADLRPPYAARVACAFTNVNGGRHYGPRMHSARKAALKQGSPRSF